MKTGNAKQREAFEALGRLGIFEKLAAYGPVLAGTFPIDIDVEGSDLDIICEMREPEPLERTLITAYGTLERFALERERLHGSIVVVCNFRFESWPVEIFAQNRPVTQQNAYKHMVVEQRILERLGPDFREHVRSLKRSGVKTEPAFAKLLGLRGDPYAALLDMHDWSEAELERFLVHKGFENA
ncbi:DUF4269 domain-containing protein [Paenibacillus sp. VCA1]|uniref:DUF4269 domain-containing protein n=1 Tax=Paenibacillus sp. VCA1 TaxID=3039148 RepID=UPI00287271F0|nr:DUF4269 domain-containing protein [Paenibacillus sp. VCA1]MDR9854751.1 DUF4269 domain-containing protein [Paenibacillus sp. VCA1]